MYILVDGVWILAGSSSKPAVRDNFHDSELSTIWYATIRPGMNYVRGNLQRTYAALKIIQTKVAINLVLKERERKKEKNIRKIKNLWNANSRERKRREDYMISKNLFRIIRKNILGHCVCHERSFLPCFHDPVYMWTRRLMRVEQCVVLCVQPSQATHVRPSVIMDACNTFGRRARAYVDNTRQANKGDIFFRRQKRFNFALTPMYKRCPREQF